ncbi:hypothetical protein [Streptomyces rimosus]|uniref:hypothetical protein n=1 Tax=Streptomyces rimosus TaxID=1927 RepID=UPI0004C801C1|nr:hypothetical protein [Streptomyces rimosus]
MPLSYSDAKIQAKAELLGLVQPGSQLPRRLRGKVVAALAAEQQRPAVADDVPLATSIIVEPGGGITVDGRPFPWIVQADRIEVTIGPDGAGMVRLTIPAANVQITKPATPESENRA